MEGRFALAQGLELSGRDQLVPTALAWHHSESAQQEEPFDS